MIGANTYTGSENEYRQTMSRALTATLIFATRSARELPTANIVKPIIASDRPKMKPNVCTCNV